MKDLPRQLATDSLVIFTGIALGLVSFASFNPWSSTQTDFTASSQLSAVMPPR